MTRTTNRSRETRTAAQAYKASAAQIRSQIAAIESRLMRHAVKAAAEPTNWNLQGDLSHVVHCLGEILAFLDNQG